MTNKKYKAFRQQNSYMTKNRQAGLSVGGELNVIEDLSAQNEAAIPFSEADEVSLGGLEMIEDSNDQNEMLIPFSEVGGFALGGLEMIEDSNDQNEMLIPFSEVGGFALGGLEVIEDLSTQNEEVIPLPEADRKEETADAASAKQKKQTNEDRRVQLQKKYPGLDLKTIVMMVCAAQLFARRSGKTHYYNGRFYQQMTRARFVSIAINVIPEEMLQGVKSMRLFNDSFDFYTYMQLDEPETATSGEWVTFENCDFNVRTGFCAPHSSEHLTFFEVHASYTPENLECPYMDGLLDFMTDGDRVSVQLVWEMLGFLMLDMPAQRAFFYIGTAPASGKSVLLSFIGRLFGSEECHRTEADKLGGKFGLSNFINQRIGLSLESRGDLSKATITAIKGLTGNDKISIERKNHDPVDIVNHTRLIMASNDPLYIEDEAFWDRCKIIPAVQSRPPEQMDPDLDDKIWEERDAIATRAVMTAKTLMERKFRFIESKYALALKDEWRHEVQDPIRSFLEQQVEFVPGADFISTNQLYEAYQKSGYKPMRERGFSMKLSHAIGNRATKDRVGAHGYYGIVLREPRA